MALTVSLHLPEYSTQLEIQFSKKIIQTHSKKQKRQLKLVCIQVSACTGFVVLVAECVYIKMCVQTPWIGVLAMQSNHLLLH